MEILYIITSIMFLLCPNALSRGAELGCGALKSVVIRSLFPMMVLTRLIAGSRLFGRLAKLLGRLFLWRRLNLSDALIPSVLTGLVAGLPNSAVEIQTLLSQGRITKEEASKGLALSSLPSPAFVITVAFGDIKRGIICYVISVLVAYAVVSFFPSQKSVGGGESTVITFSSALSSSLGAALAVSANIIFFNAVACLIAYLLPVATIPVAIFLEMGSGVLLADGDIFFTSAALGWCGLSAMSQLRSVAPDVSLTPYAITRIISVFVLVFLQKII